MDLEIKQMCQHKITTVMLGDNAGLIVAEVELKSEDQAFDRPAWLGDEVTGDTRYYNANLIKKPFTRWR